MTRMQRMLKWLWVVALGMTTHTQPLYAKPSAPPPSVLSQELRDGVRAYLTTPASESSRAEALRAELAPALEEADFGPEDWLGLVRQVFPLVMPEDVTRRDFLTRHSDVSERLDYALLLPDDYTPDTSWPLHITLHGGRRDGFYCRTYWPQLREQRQSSILLCPSAFKGRFHSKDGEAAFLAALHDTMRTFNIDPERISIDGLSTGASAAWTLTAKHPGRWRAMVSRAGGPLLFPVNARAPGYTNLHATPLLLLHGAKDPLIRVGTARTGVRILKDLNIFHEYWEDPSAGHDTFSERNQDIAAWIEPRRRAALSRGFSHVSGNLGIEAPMLYWLYATDHPGELEARIEGNTVTVSHSKLTELTVFLPEALLRDPSAPVEIIVNGARAFEGVVSPSIAAAMASYWKTFDHTRIFTRAVVLKLSTQEGSRRAWRGEALR